MNRTGTVAAFVAIYVAITAGQEAQALQFGKTRAANPGQQMPRELTLSGNNSRSSAFETAFSVEFLNKLPGLIGSPTLNALDLYAYKTGTVLNNVINGDGDDLDYENVLPKEIIVDEKYKPTNWNKPKQAFLAKLVDGFVNVKNHVNSDDPMVAFELVPEIQENLGQAVQTIVRRLKSRTTDLKDVVFKMRAIAGLGAWLHDGLAIWLKDDDSKYAFSCEKNRSIIDRLFVDTEIAKSCEGLVEKVREVQAVVQPSNKDGADFMDLDKRARRIDEAMRIEGSRVKRRVNGEIQLAAIGGSQIPCTARIVELVDEHQPSASKLGSEAQITNLQRPGILSESQYLDILLQKGALYGELESLIGQNLFMHGNGINAWKLFEYKDNPSKRSVAAELQDRDLPTAGMQSGTTNLFIAGLNALGAENAEVESLTPSIAAYMVFFGYHSFAEVVPLMDAWVRRQTYPVTGTEFWGKKINSAAEFYKTFVSKYVDRFVPAFGERANRWYDATIGFEKSDSDSTNSTDDGGKSSSGESSSGSVGSLVGRFPPRPYYVGKSVFVGTRLLNGSFVPA